MSVSRKVIRKIKKVMGVIVTSASLIPISSQVSFAIFKTWCDGNVRYRFDGERLLIEGNGQVIRKSIENNLTEEEMKNILVVGIFGKITNIDICAFLNFKSLVTIEIISKSLLLVIVPFLIVHI